METTRQTTAMIDPLLWKALDIIHKRTRMPKKHLLTLFTRHFVDSDEGKALLETLGVGESDLEIVQRLLNEALTVQAEAA